MTEHANPEPESVEGEVEQDAKAKFRAALDAKKARHNGTPEGGRGGGSSAGPHVHGAAGGQKMFRRKSGG